jgi:predicted DNA-binding transcriptional regulator AlpA
MQTPSIPSPQRVAALEKIPHAAKRMGISTCQTYREIKAGPLVKVGERASALPSVAVDAWIQAKIDAAQGVAK